MKKMRVTTQYKGKPVLLIGGSDNDSPFQILNIQRTPRVLRTIQRVKMRQKYDKKARIYPFQQTCTTKLVYLHWSLLCFFALDRASYRLAFDIQLAEPRSNAA